MIKVEKICKSFGETNVLKNVSFSIEKGETTAVIGPSGGGKTTLLRCLNFLERADSGTLELDSEKFDLHTISRRQINALRCRTSFVFQGFNLFANKTALENITEVLIYGHKMKKSDAITAARAALERVGLSGREDAYPSELSGGQQQRTAIARALAPNPEIIYLDEPTSALDPVLTDEVLRVLGSLASDGITMLLVTHELSFARSAAKHVLFMDNGEIAEQGSEEILTAPQTEQLRRFISGGEKKEQGIVVINGKRYLELD